MKKRYVAGCYISKDLVQANKGNVKKILKENLESLFNRLVKKVSETTDEKLLNSFKNTGMTIIADVMFDEDVHDNKESK